VPGVGYPEITFYGFTVDNTKRPGTQIEAFRNACVEAVAELEKRDADLLWWATPSRCSFQGTHALHATDPNRRGRIKVNFLVNYGWNWDLNHSLETVTRVRVTTSPTASRPPIFQGSISSCVGAAVGDSVVSCLSSRSTPTFTSSMNCGRIFHLTSFTKHWRVPKIKTSRLVVRNGIRTAHFS